MFLLSGIRLQQHRSRGEGNNTEESVADLELGLTAVAAEVDDLENGVGNLENDVTNLEESQNTQDERFLTVEAEVEDLEDQVLGMDQINM